MGSGIPSAGVAELVDAADSKSASGNRMSVRVRPPAPFFAANLVCPLTCPAEVVRGGCYCMIGLRTQAGVAGGAGVDCGAGHKKASGAGGL